jgi:hypothetical protein
MIPRPSVKMADLLNSDLRICVQDSGGPIAKSIRTILHQKEIIMKISRLMFRSVLLLLGLGCCCLLPLSHARGAAGASVPVPNIIQNGFSLWAKNRQASWAFDAWKIGGLMERDNKPDTLSRYFSRIDLALGAYKSYEVIETKRISQNSGVIYLSVNFDRAVMFGRFLMYQTDKDWVVQNMDFSPKPEAMMPWLAFEGDSYTQ